MSRGEPNLKKITIRPQIDAVVMLQKFLKSDSTDPEKSQCQAPGVFFGGQWNICSF